MTGPPLGLVVICGFGAVCLRFCPTSPKRLIKKAPEGASLLVVQHGRNHCSDKYDRDAAQKDPEDHLLGRIRNGRDQYVSDVLVPDLQLVFDL